MSEDDRELTFSQRHGYKEIPDIMNPDFLSKKFRNRLWLHIDQYTDDIWQMPEYPPFVKQLCMDFWERPHDDIGAMVDIWSELKGLALSEECHEVISFCEFALRNLPVREPLRKGILTLFSSKPPFAPYMIDGTGKSLCIVPLSSIEAADAIKEAFKSVHASGVPDAHNRLRVAAQNINDQQYPDTVANSIHAVEALARELTGKKTLGQAIKQLDLNDRFQKGIENLYAYASDTARHGQPSKKESDVSREEAMLIFTLCAGIAGYLAQQVVDEE